MSKWLGLHSKHYGIGYFLFGEGGIISFEAKPTSLSNTSLYTNDRTEFWVMETVEEIKEMLDEPNPS